MAKRANFLKNILATASIAAVVAGGSTAFATAQLTGNAALNNAANWNPANIPANGATITYDGLGAHTLNANVANAQLAGILVNNAGAPVGLMTVTDSLTVGSIQANVNGDLLPVSMMPNQTLTLNGSAGAAGVGVNNYSGLGNIDFGLIAILPNPPRTTILTVIVGPNAPGVANANFKSATVVNGYNGTLNVTPAAGTPVVPATLTVSDASFATVKTINIYDNATLQFNSTATAITTLNLQPTLGDTINFVGNTGGTLYLQSKAGSAENFTVINGTLGGVTDQLGTVTLDTSAVPGTLESNAGKNNPVVGNSNTQRVNQFVVISGANPATINGGVYAKQIKLNGNGGNVSFNGAIDVGNNGGTVFSGAATTLEINPIVTAGPVQVPQVTNLGQVDFNNAGSQIIVLAPVAGAGGTPAPAVLTGNFVGQASGQIIFDGAGTLGGTPGVTNAPVVNNLISVESNGGAVTLSQGTYTTELRLTNNAASFALADGFMLTGDVNKTNPVGANPLAPGNLTIQGKAYISGSIGVGTPVGGINFGANGGTLSLTNGTNAVNTIINAPINVAANGNGVIAANNISANQTLIITGNIGINAAGGAPGKGLAQLSADQGNITLNGNDVNINNVLIANNATLTLAGAKANYTIGTQSNANQGIVTFTGAGGAALLAGSNLGSNDAPLNAINVAGNTLILDRNVNLYANNLNSIGAGVAKLFIGGNPASPAGTTTINAVIGSANNPFDTIIVGQDTTAILGQNTSFTGNATLNSGAVLQLGGVTNKFDSITGAAAGDGSVKFSNTAAATISLAGAAGAAVNEINSIEIAGGDVKLNTTVGGAAAGELDNIETKTILFSSTQKPTFTLPNGATIDNFNINSTAGAAVPTIAVSGADQVITNVVGAANNIVNISLNSANQIDVQQSNFFASITNNKADQVGAVFNAGAGNTGSVYGLGSSSAALAFADIVTNTQNFGNTYVSTININNNITYTASEVVDVANLQLHNGSSLIFNDGVKISKKTNIDSVNAANGIVTFNGSSTINGIIGSKNFLEEVNFVGTNQNVQKLGGVIYANTIDFGSTNIALNESVVTLVGYNSLKINGEIALSSGKLALVDNISKVGSEVEFGANTMISTTLNANGELGSIDVTNASLKIDNTLPIVVRINDNARLDNGKIIFIDANRDISFASNIQHFDTTIFDVTGGNRYTSYVIDRDPNNSSDKRIYLIREDKSAVEAKADMLAFGGDSTDLQNVDALTNPNNARNSDVNAFVTNISNLSREAAATAMKKVVAVGQQVTNEQNVVYAGATNLIMTRVDSQLSADRYLPYAAPAAGGDELSRYGSWATPFYSQAHQKAKGAVSGYKAKTFGGIFGYDGRVNDNLTIGVAVTALKTDMKYKNIKAGDKTKINSFMFSLYGAQQLLDNFFVQGIASYGSGKVKIRDKRIIDNNGTRANEIAHGNYNTMAFGGEFLFGYDAKPIDSVLFTPMAGLRYTKLQDEAYKETGTTSQNRSISKKSTDKVEGIIGARVTTAIESNGITVAPEAHGFITHKLGGKNGKVSAKLDGMVDSFVIRSDKSAKTLYNIGVGVSAKTNSIMEYGVGYDATLATKYIGHQGTLKVRVNF